MFKKDKSVNLEVGAAVDRESMDKAIAEIESAFPRVVFNGNVKNVYVNYTQNNFRDKLKHECNEE
jgi:hypothetical protein